MTSAKSRTRWRIAQSAEKYYWKKARDRYAGVPASTWLPLAKVATMWNNTLDLGFSLNHFVDKTVVEIGCGPAGISTVLRAKLKVGLDPLVRDYQKDFNINTEECEYVLAMGENIPIRDGSIDVVFCVNVLDHVMDPNWVLSEADRVLDRNGILILGATIHSEVSVEASALVSNWSEPFKKIYRGLNEFGRRRVAHPHRFRDEDLFKTIKGHGYEIERCMMKSVLRGDRFEAVFMTMVCKRS